MSEEIPHPRDVYDWSGDEAHERAFVDALARGRLHHAWLITGTEGVGKATFAYRVARRLLGAKPDPQFGPLGCNPHDHVCRLVMGRAHPDLLVLQRDPETGKARRDIPVDEARALPEFFAKSPATAPYRVAIIDQVDDLNASGANAVLKTLEEPPPRGVLLLISSAPGGLLPTIRSRCRRLRLDIPHAGPAMSWLAARAGTPPDQTAALLEMARGAPGAAWRLAAQGALEADRQVRDLLDAMPDLDPKMVQGLSDSFRGPQGMARFELFFSRLADQIHRRARLRAETGDLGLALDRQVAAWEDILQAQRLAEGLNLDRGDLLHTTLAKLRGIA